MRRLSVFNRTFLMNGVVAAVMLHSGAFAGDWSQWRGSNRNGVDSDSPTLIRKLPAEGQPAAWISPTIRSGGNGGWGSPAVTGGRVYLFVHTREPKPGLKLPDPRYPALSDEKKKEFGEKALQEYERHRHLEERERRRISHDVVETVYCFDADTGEGLWTNDRPSQFTEFSHSGTPAVVDGRLYILGAGGVARAIDAVNGRDLWQTQLPGDFTESYHMSSFAVAEGVAAVLAGHLFGLDAETGAVRWQGEPQRTSGSHSSPVVWDSPEGPLFIINVAGQDTTCVVPRDGREVWRVKSEAELSTPVVVGSKLLTLGNSRKKGLRCFQMNSEGAELLWTFTGVADKGSSPVVVGDSVFVQGEQRLACVDLQTGKANWQHELDLQNPQYTSLAAADGKIFYTYGCVLCFAADSSEFKPLFDGRIDRDGRLAEIATFQKLAGLDQAGADANQREQAERKLQQRLNGQGPLECASPALDDGRLYVRLPRGVACFDLRAASAGQAR